MRTSFPTSTTSSATCLSLTTTPTAVPARIAVLWVMNGEGSGEQPAGDLSNVVDGGPPNRGVVNCVHSEEVWISASPSVVVRMYRWAKKAVENNAPAVKTQYVAVEHYLDSWTCVFVKLHFSYSALNYTIGPSVGGQLDRGKNLHGISVLIGTS
jgi:hypothetical protein